MTLFHPQPKLRKADVPRLLPHLGNVRTTLRPWLATNPPQDDLKLAVLLEIERARSTHSPLVTVNRGVLDLLLRQIRRNELGDIYTAITEELKS